MRVIGGRWRGRRLPAGVPAEVRPTSDRVREAVFNVLASLDVVTGASVVDLFCGSGAMGLEALSRGASSVVFVDRSALALDAVRANAGHLGADERHITVVQASLPRWLEAPSGTTVSRHGPWDLALCDPPYAFAQWPRLLASLRARVAVLEAPAEVGVPGTWEVVRARRYGGTLVTVVKYGGAWDEERSGVSRKGGSQ